MSCEHRKESVWRPERRKFVSLLPSARQVKRVARDCFEHLMFDSYSDFSFCLLISWHKAAVEVGPKWLFL